MVWGMPGFLHRCPKLGLHTPETARNAAECMLCKPSIQSYTGAKPTIRPIESPRQLDVRIATVRTRVQNIVFSLHIGSPKSDTVNFEVRLPWAAADSRKPISSFRFPGVDGLKPEPQIEQPMYLSKQDMTRNNWCIYLFSRYLGYSRCTLNLKSQSLI